MTIDLLETTAHMSPAGEATQLLELEGPVLPEVGAGFIVANWENHQLRFAISGELSKPAGGRDLIFLSRASKAALEMLAESSNETCPVELQDARAQVSNVLQEEYDLQNN